MKRRGSAVVGRASRHGPNGRAARSAHAEDAICRPSAAQGRRGRTSAVGDARERGGEHDPGGAASVGRARGPASGRVEGWPTVIAAWRPRCRARHRRSSGSTARPTQRRDHKRDAGDAVGVTASGGEEGRVRRGVGPPGGGGGNGTRSARRMGVDSASNSPLVTEGDRLGDSHRGRGGGDSAARSGASRWLRAAQASRLAGGGGGRPGKARADGDGNIPWGSM